MFANNLSLSPSLSPYLPLSLPLSLSPSLPLSLSPSLPLSLSPSLQMLVIWTSSYYFSLLIPLSCTHSHTHLSTHKCKQTCTHKLTHTYAHMHAHTHTHTYTYIKTQKQTCTPPKIVQTSLQEYHATENQFCICIWNRNETRPAWAGFKTAEEGRTKIM